MCVELRFVLIRCCEIFLLRWKTPRNVRFRNMRISITNLLLVKAYDISEFDRVYLRDLSDICHIAVVLFGTPNETL